MDIDSRLDDINRSLNLSKEGLNEFSHDLFQIARGEFNLASVAEAADILARQGLDKETVLRRTRDALILTRLTGLDIPHSIQTLNKAKDDHETR